MKLIIGLGNPGTKYLKNRHNVGHMLVENLESRSKNLGEKWKLLKSTEYMNNSGRFLKKILDSKFQPLDSIYVAHDDLDLKLGTYKIQFGVGPKVHNGIKSVEEELGTKDFWRIRIGIESRILNLESRMSGEKFVLEDFTAEEFEILKQVQDDILCDLCKN